MQFSLAKLFLTLTSCIVIISVLSKGGIIAVLPVLGTMLLLYYLISHRYYLASFNVAAIYCVLWLATVLLGSYSVKAEFSSRDMPNVLDLIDKKGINPFDPLKSSSIYTTEGPWYYVRVVAVPAPLLVVVDSAWLTQSQTGGANRRLMLWWGFGQTTVWYWLFWVEC